MVIWNKFSAIEKPEIPLEELVVCPKCGSDDTSHLHTHGNASVPETDYEYCNDCNYQWGFE
jgi:DNA-directed RNA polymerase subunit M/transcription elongation factor TFIIS